MEQTKYKKYIKLYVPMVAFDHFTYKLAANKPSFEYDVDIFYSILSDLSDIYYFKSFEYNNGFLPFYSQFLKKKYGNNYNLYIQYLVANSIITESAYYSEDNCYHYKLNVGESIIDYIKQIKSSSSYCFNSNERISLVSIDGKGFQGIGKTVNTVEIVCVKVPTTSTFGKRTVKEYQKALDRLKHSPDHIKVMAAHYKSTIGIRYDDAIAYTMKTYQHEQLEAQEDAEMLSMARNRYIHRMRSIIALKEGRTGQLLRFKRNQTNRRIDSNLTNMTSDLRPFLIGFDNMSYLDLTNSQPVLFNVLLNKYRSKATQQLLVELDRYQHDTLNGVWYETVQAIFKTDRAQAKDIWMELAYSKNASFKAHKRAFKSVFPEISNIIKTMKEVKHSKLAVDLQLLESRIFIDEICKQLVDRDIIPLTLHDGLLVLHEHQHETYNIMCEVLHKHLGAVPVIAINGTKVYK